MVTPAEIQALETSVKTAHTRVESLQRELETAMKDERTKADLHAQKMAEARDDAARKAKEAQDLAAKMKP